jgi:Protein of unknown function (DUF1573)
MKQLISLFLGVFAFITTAYAQERWEKLGMNPTTIQFQKEKVDYGTIKVGSEPYRTLEFKNSGADDLLISAVVSNCGCVVVTFPKEIIKSGESGVLKIWYDTNRVGPFTKSFVVKYNTKTPEQKIFISGMVNQ